MKKFLKLFISAAMMLTLAACGGGKKGPDKVTLKVWASQEDQTVTQEMINAFIEEQKKDYPETEFDITLAVVSEADARQKVLEDPAAAANVFTFANDQLSDLVKAGALAEVTRNKDDIVSRNGEGAIEAATKNGSLYAYPMTADNGYFLYYNSAVITDPSTLDGILKAANDAGKKVFMDVSNGWYIASFFLGNGGKLGIDEDGYQTCDFNNANGLAAAEAIKAFTADPAFITGDDAVLNAGFQDGTIVAGVSGVWNADTMKANLGDNYAATKLPTFTVGGEQVQMSSFGGYKLVGVNSQTDSDMMVFAMDLADWLTNESNQVKRFEARGYGPSNIKAAASDAVQANVALAALSLQSQYAVSQNDVLGSYWSPAEALGTTLEAKDYSTPLQDLLDTMVSQIVAR
ncbi:MAG: extracellular solute-binding protein [Traorella sp.]